MSRQPDLRPLPNSHPSVDESGIRTMTIYGHTGPCAPITCPDCGNVRWLALRVLRHQIARQNFTGACRACWTVRPKELTMRTSRNPTGRGINSAGYVTLAKNAIADADLPMWIQMKGVGGYVFEHRWVMAKQLGRALTGNELVDHLNGNKTDNRLQNLRLYVRGKQQPGSAPGHGTYYDEWQVALARIRELEAAMT